MLSPWVGQMKILPISPREGRCCPRAAGGKGIRQVGVGSVGGCWRGRISQQCCWFKLRVGVIHPSLNRDLSGTTVLPTWARLWEFHDENKLICSPPQSFQATGGCTWELHLGVGAPKERMWSWGYLGGKATVDRTIG